MSYESKSYICREIADCPYWKEMMKKLGITIKYEGNTYIMLNYGIDSNFANPIVQEARGIIIDITYPRQPTVACWPFRKFGNYQEPYADKIDWSMAAVQEKIDGSIVKMWWDLHQNRWRWSTNSVIDAGNAYIDSSQFTFLDLIHKADNYEDVINAVNRGELDTNRTYIFELVSPYNQIVIKYPSTHLYHLGTRDNTAGQEYGHTIDMDKPCSYMLCSMDDCINAAAELNKGANGVAHEGFVVVDANWHRIKIKSPEYLLMHHVRGNGQFPAKKIVGGLRSGILDANEMCKAYPDLAHIFRYYQWQIEEFKYQATEICQLVDRLYEEFGGNRKAIAIGIKNSKYMSIGFIYLDCGRIRSSDEILGDMNDNQYLKYIVEYKRRN